MSVRPPFNAEAGTKEELEASRTPEFLQLEIRALKGGATREALVMGVQPLTVEEQHLMSEYLALHQKLGNEHIDGWEASRFGSSPSLLLLPTADGEEKRCTCACDISSPSPAAWHPKALSARRSQVP